MGSFGGRPRSGEYDIANRTSAALFVGPPNFNTLYGSFVADRDPGTHEVDPVYKDGRIVRFTNVPEDPAPPDGEPWQEESRTIYLVHPSDPIVWWSPNLLLTRPDWLEEDRGRDVLDEMVWIPFVTFWQVTADLPMATGVPPGHGHDYGGQHVYGWADILQLEVGPTPTRSGSARSRVANSPCVRAGLIHLLGCECSTWTGFGWSLDAEGQPARSATGWATAVLSACLSLL